MQAWLFQGVGNEHRFIEMFKTRVKDIFMQDWHARLETSIRARFYNTFANFRYQNYLDDINVERYRTSLSKLRLPSHRLEVEAGRWAKPNKIPYENRKCKICDNLEDKFHFVFDCALYVEIRQKYISKYFWKHPSMIKLIELLCTDSKKNIKMLSMYVDKLLRLERKICQDKFIYYHYSLSRSNSRNQERTC